MLIPELEGKCQSAKAKIKIKTLELEKLVTGKVECN